MKKYVLILSLIIGTSTAIAATNTSEKKSQVIEISVTATGFEPANVKVASGVDTTLMVTRKTDATCAKQIVIPSKKIKTELPLNKPVKIAIGKLEKGEIRFSCAMHMISGVIEAN